MACSSSAKSAPGGYLIFSDRNRSEPARYQIMFGKTHSFAAAQWNGPKHGAYPASFGDRRLVDRSSHEVRMAISPTIEAPVTVAIRARIAALLP
jgi:hypothetical protein